MMRSPTRTCGLILMLLIMASGLQAQEPGLPPGIDWQPELKAAMKRAKSENRPLLVAFILQGEVANEEICGEHFQDPAIIELSRKFVCLLALATYKSSDVGTDMTRSKALVQSLEGRASLKDLAKVEMDARFEWMESNQVSAPQFLFINPDGETMLLRHVWLLDRKALLNKMHKALHFFDPEHPLPSDLEVAVKADGDRVGELLELSDDNNMQKRREALNELADIEDPRVVSFLIDQTGNDVDQAKRLEAINAMGRDGGAKFLPRLHELLLKERSHQVRTNVSDALRRIAMIESVEPLLKVLKSEKKSQVRSLLLRALITCGSSRDDVQKELEKLLTRGDGLDQITIMSQLPSMAWDERYERGILKCMKSTDSQVRAAAYWVAGSHNLASSLKPMKMRFSTEKSVSRNACAWALERLGESVGESGNDPSHDVTAVLPSASF